MPTRHDTSRPTVWLFTDVYPPRVSGAAFIASSWTNWLPAFGLNVHAFVPRGAGKNWDRSSSTTTRFKSLENIGFWGDDWAVFSTIKEVYHLRDKLPDLILISTPGRIGYLGATIGQFHRVPFVVVYTTDIVDYAKYYGSVRPAVSMFTKVAGLLLLSKPARESLKRPIRSGSLKNGAASRLLRAQQAGAKATILLSEKLRPTVCQWAQAATETVTIPAGVDRLPRSTVDCVPDLGGRSGLRLLYVGRLAREKNLGVIINCAEVLAQRGVNYHLLMVGDGEERSRLESKVGGLGLREQVRFTGTIARDQLAQFYEWASFFVFPSLSDTQALVLNEAAHEGACLVIADPVLNPVAVPGESAQLAMPHGAAFADAIEMLASDPGLRDRLANAARDKAIGMTEAGQAHRLAQYLLALLRA